MYVWLRSHFEIDFLKKWLPSAVGKCKTVSGNVLFWLNMLEIREYSGRFFGFLDIAAAVT